MKNFSTLLNALCTILLLESAVSFHPTISFKTSSPSTTNLHSSPSAFTRTGTMSNVPGPLNGKVAFVAGVADSTGYGWSIAKSLASQGCTILTGTWPPVLKIFQLGLAKGDYKSDSVLPCGGTMDISKVYPLDAVYDRPEDVPDDVKSNKRYAGLSGYTITEVAASVKEDYGQIDYLIHSLANGPEVTKPLLQTSRSGYLSASSASAYSLISLVQNFLPFMTPSTGSVLSLTYAASERTVPGYGGGMSSAKAALESDTRVLAYEAGRSSGVRVNTISAGALKSRAASAIGKTKGEGEVKSKTFIEKAIDYSAANAPLSRDLSAEDVGSVGCFLLGPGAKGVTGSTVYVDNGLNTMGVAWGDAASLR